ARPVRRAGAKGCVVPTGSPGASPPPRRALGAYGALTLDKARMQARQWLELIGRGIDPAGQVEEERRQRERERATTFASVCEDYLAREIVGLEPERTRKRRAAQLKPALT